MCCQSLSSLIYAATRHLAPCVSLLLSSSSTLLFFFGLVRHVQVCSLEHLHITSITLYFPSPPPPSPLTHTHSHMCACAHIHTHINSECLLLLRRKVFHLSGVVVFLSGIAVDPNFTALASSVIFFLFIVAEVGSPVCAHGWGGGGGGLRVCLYLLFLPYYNGVTVFNSCCTVSMFPRD